MSSIRLNSFYKDQIVRAAIAASFDPRFAKQAADEHALGMRFYEKVLPEAERKAARKMSKRWVAFDSCLRFNVGGMRMQFDVEKEVVVPANGGYCSPLGALTEQKDIDDARKHHDAKSDLRKERDKASTSLRVMLDTVSTIAKLREVWPQGEPFYKALEPASKLPAPVIGDINKMLGLAA